MLCAAPAHAADPALIAAAQREGQVTWYTTQITNQFGRPAMDAFQKRYGIRVSFVRADSIELAVRVVNEAQAGRLQADVSKDAPHPNAAKLLVDFLRLGRGTAALPRRRLHPGRPRCSAARTGVAAGRQELSRHLFSPEQIDAAMPHWMDVYNEIFR
jgi:ABC-type Fe3+ transport system substrate-binding protein